MKIENQNENFLLYPSKTIFGLFLEVSQFLSPKSKKNVENDFLEQRFGRSSRVLISVVFQISRSFATAIMIYAISIILQSTMGLAFWQSVLLIGVITLIYSLQGGMKAVVYGDAVQMILIVAGALVCLGFGLGTDT